MQIRDMKQRSVNVHDFSMIPKAEIPRSQFRMQKNLKTTFSFSYLVPILVEEVLPGDHWRSHATIVARTPAAIAPVMDNWHIETFAFFVPCRLVWNNWQKFMGEQDNPGDSTLSPSRCAAHRSEDGSPEVSRTTWDYLPSGKSLRETKSPSTIYR